MIRRYFTRVRRKFQELSWLITSESVAVEWVSEDMGIIRGEVIFLEGTRLDFRELVTEQTIDYRFQYMDRNNVLITRWDTAPHHREIRTFPYHLQPSQGVSESEKMNVVKVLDLVAIMVVNNLSSIEE